MPIVQTRIDREEILAVVADTSHVQRLKPNFLDRNYFLDDSAGQRYIYPGMILAQDSNTSKYVPFNASALYGVGSDTAVGVLETFENANLADPAISPIYHAKLIEAHCYVFAGALGTVPAAVKTSLNMVEWV